MASLAPQRLPLFERYLSVWVLAAILAGVGLAGVTMLILSPDSGSPLLQFVLQNGERGAPKILNIISFLWTMQYPTLSAISKPRV